MTLCDFLVNDFDKETRWDPLFMILVIERHELKFFFSISFVKLRSCKNEKRFDGKLLQEKKLNNDGNNFTTFFPWKWLRYAESIQPCFRIIKNSTCANLKYKRGTGHSVEIKWFSVIKILCEINFDKYIMTILS